MPRQICEVGRPYDPQNPEHRTQQWEHPQAHETDRDSDYTIEYMCPICQHIWLVEMPD